MTASRSPGAPSAPGAGGRGTGTSASASATPAVSRCWCATHACRDRRARGRRRERERRRRLPPRRRRTLSRRRGMRSEGRKRRTTDRVGGGRAHPMPAVHRGGRHGPGRGGGVHRQRGARQAQVVLVRRGRGFRRGFRPPRRARAREREGRRRPQGGEVGVEMGRRSRRAEEEEEEVFEATVPVRRRLRQEGLFLLPSGMTDVCCERLIGFGFAEGRCGRSCGAIVWHCCRQVQLVIMQQGAETF